MAISPARMPMDNLPARTDISEREWRLLQHKAAAMTGSSMVPAAYKEQDLFNIGLAARAVGMDLTPLTVNEFPVIEGKITPSAQISVAIVAAHGHTMWPEEYGPERCTYAGHRKGMSDRVLRVTWTLDMARQAGKLDEWVEKWETAASGKKYAVRFVMRRQPDGTFADTDANGVKVPEWAWKEVQAGKLKRHENWWRYTADMLAARAAKRLARMIAGDALLGMAVAPLWDDDDDQAGDDATPAAGSPLRRPPSNVDTDTGEILDSDDDDTVDAELVEDPGADPTDDPLVDDTWVQQFARTLREAGWTDQQRHELIHHSTSGRVRSSKEVRRSEVPNVRRAYKAVLDGRLVWTEISGVHVLTAADGDTAEPF